MTIERLTVGNLTEVVEIGKSFTAEVAYPGGFDLAAFSAQWVPALQMGIGEIFAAREGGRIVALLGAAFVNDTFSGWKTALEQFWYCLPEYRGGSSAFRLLREFEKEAKVRQCRRILMVHLDTAQSGPLEKMYRSRGYFPIEKTFCKLI